MDKKLRSFRQAIRRFQKSSISLQNQKRCVKFSASSWQNVQLMSSLSPILTRDTFVAKVWWRNLTWNSISLVLLVHLIAVTYALCQIKSRASGKTLLHFSWLVIFIATIYFHQFMTAALMSATYKVGGTFYIRSHSNVERFSLWQNPNKWYACVLASLARYKNATLDRCLLELRLTWFKKYHVVSKLN